MGLAGARQTRGRDDDEKDGCAALPVADGHTIIIVTERDRATQRPQKAAHVKTHRRNMYRSETSKRAEARGGERGRMVGVLEHRRRVEV